MTTQEDVERIQREMFNITPEDEQQALELYSLCEEVGFDPYNSQNIPEGK